MYCTNCGKKLNNNNICEKCYVPLPSKEDKGNIGWAILSFFFPLAGLVLYIVWFKSNPNNANVAGVGAIIGAITKAIIIILLLLVFVFYLSDNIANIIDWSIDRAIIEKIGF